MFYSVTTPDSSKVSLDVSDEPRLTEFVSQAHKHVRCFSLQTLSMTGRLTIVLRA